MTRISQAGDPDRYAIVVGHTGPRHDRLRIALWQLSAGTKKQVSGVWFQMGIANAPRSKRRNLTPDT